MFSPKKVDGGWASSPKESDDASMQHRQSKPGSSKGSRNTMSERGDEKNQEKHPRAVYDAKVNLRISDCLVMLECSPQPEEAFHPNSRECQCARKWLNELTSMKCDTVLEACLRNGYISALSVCLNQKSLYGIFEQMPPEELNLMKILDTSTNASSNHSSFRSNHASRQQFESTRGPQRPFETMNLESPQSSSQQPREAVDRQQRFMEEPQGPVIEPQIYRAEEPQRFQQQRQRYQEQPQKETFYDPATFPPAPHVRQQSGAYYKPSSVKFDTFGAPPRVKAASKKGKGFSPSGEEGGGVTAKDLGSAIKEAPPDSYSAMPTRSILKRNCINGQAPHVYPSYLKTPLSLKDKQYFDDEICYKSPLKSCKTKFASQKECAIKGSRQQQIEQHNTHGTPTNQWKPEASEEESDREKTSQTVITNRYCDMTFLRECIRRALRGEISEGANDYLDCEIESYKKICNRYRCDDPEYKEKMLGGDPIEQRTYLLRNMEEDLTNYVPLLRKRKMTI
ncbi:uncharacterized protein [Drosophila pseudoobscura]|uniref:DUF4485 domain-containing protein n=1 Tax=Drosophila pseudoobscura pseudoobscura TaxID=46245 RepID=A0A6I8VZ94_DROPS|nr:uncharacterized protein LOC117184017 [Drosophila pseudoobscura]